MDRSPGQRGARGWVIAIAYDGEKTEAEYFAGWRSFLGQGMLVLKPYWIRSGGNVRVAVEETVKKFQQDTDYDEAWCVCDTDDSTAADIAAAEALADASNLKLCLSTRSFETWLALHWVKSARPVSTESEAIASVAKHFPKYTRNNKVVPFEVLAPLSGEACRNGAWLEKQGSNNPQTKMHLLTKTIIQQRRRLKERR